MRYKLFDIALACNTRFNILSAASIDDNSGLDEWLLKYEKGDCESDNINVGVDQNGRVVIKIYTYAQYIIDYRVKLIIAIASSIEYIEATIFNIPMAVIAILKQNFPLHASAIMYNGHVIAFCGEKGAGKSTLIYNLLKNSDCLETPLSFFTDDALLIKVSDLGWAAYSCGEYIKLITEEIPVSEKWICPVLPNTVYKSYVHMLRRNDYGKLEKIFFVKRSSGKLFAITPITSRFEKTLNLYNNLIGIDYFSAVRESTKATMEKYEKNIHKVEMFKIELPSDMECYGNALKDLMKEILA